MAELKGGLPVPENVARALEDDWSKPIRRQSAVLMTASQRIADADAKALESALAYLAGPDAYLDYLQRELDHATTRITETRDGQGDGGTDPPARIFEGPDRDAES